MSIEPLLLSLPETVAIPLSPILTPTQSVIAKSNLRAYLKSCYTESLPFVLYTFRATAAIRHTTPTDPTARAPLTHTSFLRPTNHHSDPTGDAVVTMLDGITFPLPETRSIPAPQIRTLIESLPSHLYQLITFYFVDSIKLATLSRRLHASASTISRDLDQALTYLCSFLYGPAWPTDPTTPGIHQSIPLTVPAV